MPRHHHTPNGDVPFTPEEEAEWDAMEAAWVAGAEQRAWAAVRAERNRRLAQTDWVAHRAQELGEAVPEAWIAYRQALRDLPETYASPDEVAWPEPPVG